MLKSKTFLQFVHLQEVEKESPLLKLSEYKRERPEEYEVYNEAYKKARADAIDLHQRGVAGYTDYNYLSVKNIIAQAKTNPSIPYPKLDYETAKQKAAEDKARAERIRTGTATHADYMKVTHDLYGTK